MASEQETQRVKDLRFNYRDWSFTILVPRGFANDPRNLVFIDETGMHLGFTRLDGRSPAGERFYDSEAPGNSGRSHFTALLN